MTEKEKEFQRALGLEKGFITHLSIAVPIYISIPIIAKGFSEEEVRNRLHELPDDKKKQIILHMCQQIIAMEYGHIDKKDLGEDAIDQIEMITEMPLKNIDPKDLDNRHIEINTNTGNGTVADTIKYMKDELMREEDEILII